MRCRLDRAPVRRRLADVIVRQRRHLGMLPAHAAQTAGISRGHWYNVENHVRTPDVVTLEKMASAVGLELELIAEHHRPFLELDPGEAYELMRLAQHYRRNVQQPPEVLVTLAAKLDKWLRVRRFPGRPRRTEAAA